jgi:hypothetical protein
MHPSSGVRLASCLLLPSIVLALGGCFLKSWLPGRGNTPSSVSGPAAYVEGCQGCHPVAPVYAQSLHAAKGIRCGQCHRPTGHPEFTEPVRDATCGGCHEPQFEQVLATKHFATRDLRALDSDRAARGLLRREHFTASSAGGRHFVGDSSSGALGGRLCAACHYDEHRFGLGVVRQPQACVGCHGVPAHAAMASRPGVSNPCIQCHVRTGTTASGQVVNTHLITTSGAGR